VFGLGEATNSGTGREPGVTNQVGDLNPATYQPGRHHSGGRVVLLYRHRFITDRWGWEIPAGSAKPGEDPAARVRHDPRDTP
jgi:hypothetical protein